VVITSTGRVWNPKWRAMSSIVAEPPSSQVKKSTPFSAAISRSSA